MKLNSKKNKFLLSQHHQYMGEIQKKIFDKNEKGFNDFAHVYAEFKGMLLRTKWIIESKCDKVIYQNDTLSGSETFNNRQKEAEASSEKDVGIL